MVKANEKEQQKVQNDCANNINEKIMVKAKEKEQQKVQNICANNNERLHYYIVTQYI